MLKDAGLVQAEGLNVQQFRKAVRKAYAGYLHDPQAAVVLKEFERPYFIVGGEVGKPGNTSCARIPRWRKQSRSPEVLPSDPNIRRWYFSAESTMTWSRRACSISRKC